jgi:hypothetical protein
MVLEHVENFINQENILAPTVKHVPFNNITQNALMFQDVITWPDPDVDTNFYTLKSHDYDFNNWSDYTTNDLRMRSPQFKKNNSILTSGCSHTWGVGMKDTMTWPNFVAEHYNLGYSNVALPGSSIMFQVLNIFQYCSTFGNPKVILCMFPNFERIRVFIENNILEGKTSTTYDFGPADAFTNEQIERPKITKLPANKNILVSENHAFYNSVCFIMMLEKYCESNNIKLLWSSWEHDEYNDVFSHIFNNYIPGSAGLNAQTVAWCNNDEHDRLRNTFSDIYEHAADGPEGHFGLHWHKHVSDLFINEINNNNLLS